METYLKRSLCRKFEIFLKWMTSTRTMFQECRMLMETYLESKLLLQQKGMENGLKKIMLLLQKQWRNFQEVPQGVGIELLTILGGLDDRFSVEFLGTCKQCELCDNPAQESI